jgi:hypothetical protein
MERLTLHTALLAMTSLLTGCFHVDHYGCHEGDGYVAATPYYAVPTAGTCGSAPPALAQTAPPPLLNAPAVASATPAIRTVPGTPPPESGIIQAGAISTAEPPR